MKKASVFSTLGLALAIMIFAVPTMAAPIVSYGVSGSAGNWVLDFSVTNTLGGTNYIYFFGVQLPAPDITGTPTGWNSTIWPTWSNSSFGGSSIIYNNNWIDGEILNGNTLSGFNVTVNTTTAPTSVPWFAYGYGGTYSGTDHFNNSGNPGFEGRAGSAVPLPGALLLFGPGLVGLAAIRRRVKK